MRQGITGHVKSAIEYPDTQRMGFTLEDDDGRKMKVILCPALSSPGAAFNDFQVGRRVKLYGVMDENKAVFKVAEAIIEPPGDSDKDY